MMKPVVNIDTMDNSAVGNSGGLPASNTTEKMSHQKAESLSSPEDGDYISCTNSALPEEAGDRSPIVMPSEATSNVKMSANMATKLSQMRVSRESLNDSIEKSCEDMRNELNEEPLLDPNNQANTTGRGASQKPMLRQVYPCLSCLPFENNIVFCFVLSVWDNIVGPQTVNVWKRKSFPTQKTFDDLLEKEVEVGEDLMNVRRASLQTLLGMEIHRNTPHQWRGAGQGGRVEVELMPEDTAVLPMTLKYILPLNMKESFQGNILEIFLAAPEGYHLQDQMMIQGRLAVLKPSVKILGMIF